MSQGGLVVHWRRTRPPRWRYRASLNGLGAAVTAVATVVFLATKFTEGAWAVVLALPAFIMLFTRIHRYYDQAGRALGIGGIPGKPQARPTAVVVPVTGVSRLAQDAIFGGAVYQRARGGRHSRPQRRGRGIRASS